ncbi:MAG: endonuclease III domain-containing protein [Chloroflexota bacterium]
MLEEQESSRHAHDGARPLADLKGEARRKAIAAEAVRRLEPLYGPVEWRPRYNALDELIFTVLTQHTSDSNAEVAFRTLRERLPSWMDVLEADTGEVADAIRHGGLANQKAPRIQAILRQILEEHGELELEFLSDLPLDDAKRWLTALPGVGKKSAAVVLSFSLGMPAMPVDTHIYRVARRLGLIPVKATEDQAHDIMERQVDPDDVFRYHVLLITHGRRICKAQRPICGDCPMSDLCPSRPLFEAALSRPRYRRPVRSGRPL